MISVQTNDLRSFREISDYSSVANNAIDELIGSFEDVPAWAGTCAKIKAIKLFHHTSLKYKSLNTIINDSSYCIVANILKNDNNLIKRIEVKSLKDPILTTLNDQLSKTISIMLKREFATKGVFAIISPRVKEALDKLVKLMDRMGMGAEYEYQLRILDGQTTIGEKVHYLDWFRKQKLHLVSPTAMAAFSMCVHSTQEMNEAELQEWKSRYADLTNRFSAKPNVINQLTALKSTNRNCTCVVV